jgi:hypothetical protein
MESKDRMKGVGVEGNGLDTFYGNITMFKWAEISR